jgi:hypothetical protein
LAYEEAFSLSNAQYGHLYAAYCAVFVLVHQPAGQPDERAAAEFFLQVLSKYQGGSFTGMKKPLELLRGLMSREQAEQMQLRGDEWTAWLNQAEDGGWFDTEDTVWGLFGLD